MQYGELEEAIGFAFRSCLDTPDPWRREPLEMTIPVYSF